MGFLPDIRRVLRHLPPRRQTLFFSATMPPPIAQLSREMLHDPATINLERRSAPAVGITQAVYPVPQHLKAPLLLALLQRRRDARRAGVHADEAPRQPAGEVSRRAAASRSSAFTATDRRRSAPRRWPASRAASTGCWSRPTSPRAASTSRRSATSSTSTCRRVPEDYIHRVGRTARAETDRRRRSRWCRRRKKASLRAIERAIGKRLPRVTLPDFDYNARAAPPPPPRRRDRRPRPHGHRARAPSARRPSRASGPQVRSRPGRSRSPASMTGPAYPAARDRRAEGRGAFRAPRRRRAAAAARRRVAAPPDADTIEALIDAAFWASLRREESYVPKISLAFLPPDAAPHPLLFERPLPLDAGALVEGGAGGRARRHSPRRVARRRRRCRSGAPSRDDSAAVLRGRSRGAGAAGRQASSRRRSGQVRQRRGARRRSDQDRRRARVEPAGLPAAADLAARLRFAGVVAGSTRSTCSSSSRCRCARTAAAACCWSCRPASDAWRESIVRPIPYAVSPPFGELAELIARRRPAERRRARGRTR